MNVKDLLRLDGKVALVTGGTRGIGLQIAEALGEMGADVAISARKQAELDVAQAHFDKMRIDCLTVQNDLSDFASIPGLVDAVMGHYGKIDILVNNAGCSWGAPAEEHPDEAWHKVINLNASAPFFLSREVACRSMIPRHTGKIINIGSVASFGGHPPHWGANTVAYNTSKGAILNLTRTLACEWGKYNIQVNAICPGFFTTKLSAGLLDQVEKGYIEQTPAQRLGNDLDLKGIAVLLASPASNYISGQGIAVDGGFSAS